MTPGAAGTASSKANARQEGSDNGAWIAYYSDYSSLVLFCDEVSALRYAVEHQMAVTFVRHGEEIR